MTGHVYMLDTNTVSHVIKGHPEVARRLVAVPMASLCMSSITAGELIYGLEKRPEAARIRVAVNELLRRVDVLAWDRTTADTYGIVRAVMERHGRPLGSLDLLIAAHALAVDAVLVTSDRAFDLVNELRVEDWTAA